MSRDNKASGMIALYHYRRLGWLGFIGALGLLGFFGYHWRWMYLFHAFFIFLSFFGFLGLYGLKPWMASGSGGYSQDCSGIDS